MFSKMKAVVAAASIAGVIALMGATEAGAFKVGTIGTPLGSGSMPFSSTGPAARIVVNGSLPLNCPHTTFNGSVNTGAYATMYPITIGAGQLTFTGIPPAVHCVGPSGFTFSVTCVSTSNVVVAGPPAGGPPALTPGRIAGISCSILFTALGCTGTLSGTVPTTYTNPTAALAGKLTVLTAGQSLAVTGSNCPVAVLPNGPAQFGAPVGAGTGLANLTYTLLGATSSQPFISL